MMSAILQTEFLKMRRKLIWLLVFLGPAGVICVQACNFSLRYEYLTELYREDLWGGLIKQVCFLALPALLMGVTIVASMIAGIEHQANSWKQLLALPVTKTKIFAGKLLVATFLLFLSSTLLGIGSIILGLCLQLGSDIPVRFILEMVYYPFLAVFPFISLQIWLSIVMKNQAIPLIIGIVGMILAMYGSAFPDWVPYKWPTLENQWDFPLYSSFAGLSLGVILYLIGFIDFAKRDVK
ncbi:ABC transporter permease [Viridibacillus sp. NPDC096237]|uniref:ABC transporter permease n=1 Tax=Viridibacillus sp. NPDC096237 TaxID=3390721 RepID=UPI003D032DF0